MLFIFDVSDMNFLFYLAELCGVVDIQYAYDIWLLIIFYM